MLGQLKIIVIYLDIGGRNMNAAAHGLDAIAVNFHIMTAIDGIAIDIALLNIYIIGKNPHIGFALFIA